LRADKGPAAITARSCEKALKPKKPCALPTPELLTPAEGQVVLCELLQAQVHAQACRSWCGSAGASTVRESLVQV
jgi:hypothetical protein